MTPRLCSPRTIALVAVAFGTALVAATTGPADAQTRTVIRRTIDTTSRDSIRNVITIVDAGEILRLVGELMASRQMEERVAFALREARTGRSEEARARELESQLANLARRSAALTSTLRLQCSDGTDQPEGYLGISFDVPIVVRKSVGSPELYDFGEAPRIVTVEPGSPAHRAGIEAGDHLVMIGGNDARRPLALGSMLRPGARLAVRVSRDGRERDVAVTVAKRPDDYGSPCADVEDVIASTRWAPQATFIPRTPNPPARGSGGVRAGPTNPDNRTSGFSYGLLTPFPTAGPTVIGGAQLVTIDADWRETLGVDRGLLVIAVAAGSPAQTAGLRKGDVVVAAGDVEVANTGMLWRLVNEAGSETLTLRVQRARQPVTVVFTARPPR